MPQSPGTQSSPRHRFAVPASRSPAGLPSLTLALALVLTSMAFVMAASPAPSPSAFPLDITGHWVSISYGGIDFVQKGANVTATSPAGVSISGVLSGQHLSFSFWRGKSYSAATAENRGHGTMDVAADGKTASVTWASEDPKGNFHGTFMLIKVGGDVPLETFEPEPSLEPAPTFYEWLQSAMIQQIDDMAYSLGDDDDVTFGGVSFLLVWKANAEASAEMSAEAARGTASLEPVEATPSPFDFELTTLPPPEPFPSGDPPIDQYDVSPNDFSTGGQQP